MVHALPDLQDEREGASGLNIEKTLELMRRVGQTLGDGETAQIIFELTREGIHIRTDVVVKMKGQTIRAEPGGCSHLLLALVIVHPVPQDLSGLSRLAPLVERDPCVVCDCLSPVRCFVGRLYQKNVTVPTLIFAEDPLMIEPTVRLHRLRLVADADVARYVGVTTRPEERPLRSARWQPGRAA
jgi:hypothetical protein